MSKDSTSYSSMNDEGVEMEMLDGSLSKQSLKSSPEVDYKTMFKRTALTLALVTILSIILVSLLSFFVVQQQVRLNNQPPPNSQHHRQFGTKGVACVECFDYLPDECRLARVSFADFGKEIPDQKMNSERYDRWQYNGNMG